MKKTCFQTRFNNTLEVKQSMLEHCWHRHSDTDKRNLYTALFRTGTIQWISLGLLKHTSDADSRSCLGQHQASQTPLSLTPASNPVFVSKGQTSMETCSTTLPKRWPQQCGTRRPGGAEFSPAQSSLPTGSHVAQRSSHTIFTHWEV